MFTSKDYNKYVNRSASDMIDWTKDLPTKPGWYWVDQTNRKPYREPVAVEVVEEGGELGIRDGGGFKTLTEYTALHLCYWKAEA